jgi:hypothetical protein
VHTIPEQTMSQVVENWADVEGVVEHVGPSGNGIRVELRVEAVQPVAGFPNLLAEEAGHVITVRLPHHAGSAPGTGDRVRCRVRRADVHRFFAAEGSLQRS